MNPTHMTDWPLLRDIAEPFPPNLIRKPAPGKYGSYVKHADVTQRMLSIVGFHDFHVEDTIRGYAPEIVGTNQTWPARENAVVGVTARMTITDSNGLLHSVTEVGTEDSPAMGTDAENAKNAASDAYKRCAMRLGLGLHLWCVDKDRSTYFLAGQLKADHPDEPKEET